jgi:hypothetical protein
MHSSVTAYNVVGNFSGRVLHFARDTLTYASQVAVNTGICHHAQFMLEGGV